jgi:acyl carrier protein
VSENDDAILAAIQAAFDQVLPEARRPLSPSDELVDLGVGSVAALEMAGLLEDQFEVRFPEGDLYTLRTVGDFVSLVRRSLGTRI